MSSIPCPPYIVENHHEWLSRSRRFSSRMGVCMTPASSVRTNADRKSLTALAVPAFEEDVVVRMSRLVRSYLAGFPKNAWPMA